MPRKKSEPESVPEPEFTPYSNGFHTVDSDRYAVEVNGHCLAAQWDQVSITLPSSYSSVPATPEYAVAYLATYRMDNQGARKEFTSVHLNDDGLNDLIISLQYIQGLRAVALEKQKREGF